MEFTLLWAVATAVALGWVGLRIWSVRLPDHAFDLLVTSALAGLVAGRLTAMIAQGVNPLTNPADVIVIRGGVLTGVASMMFVVTLYWSTRSSRHALDAMAPAALFSLAGWHAGCLWRGACLGTVSELPWAWALDGSTVTRHPVEIYAAIALALCAWLVSTLGWRPWLRAGSALILAGGVRLLTEPMRPSITGGPTVWYLAGLVLGAVVIGLGPRIAPARPRAPT